MTGKHKLKLLAQRNRCAPPPRTDARARGSTLAEFAFMIPLLLMGMFGVIDFGRAMYSYHFVSEAAREATRWASVRGKDCTDYPQACPAKPSDVTDYVQSIAPPGIDSSRGALTVDTNWVAPPGNASMCSPDPKNAGCAVQVQVTYNFKFILPFLPNSTYQMQSTSEMIISH